MPYKFNEPRRHKIPTAKYRVANWPDYDAALVRRGALTVWFTDEAIAEWRAPATGRRGGQLIYSALAIETALTIRLVFHQPLRQTEGLLRCIADVLGVDIAIPDHTTLSRRGVGPSCQETSIGQSRCTWSWTAPASKSTANANGWTRSEAVDHADAGVSCTSASTPRRSTLWPSN